MPPRLFDWRDDPSGTIVAVPQIRARFAHYTPGQPPRNFHTHEESNAWETWVVLQGQVRYEFEDDAGRVQAVVAGPGQAVIAAPHEKHRDCCVGETPALAFLTVSPHKPPTHTHDDASGSRQGIGPGVTNPTWQDRPALGVHYDADGTPEKILLAIGDAAEATDTLYPWMRLQEAGYQVVVAAPEVRSYQLVLHEQPPNWHITRETPGYMFDADIAFKDVKPEAYAGILISGGRAPEYIRYDRDLLNAVRWHVEHGRPVGSVCHGIEVLATAGVIKGKRIACVPKCQFDAEVCGATYVDAPVVVDGLLVTARGARDGGRWMREFLKTLDTVKAAQWFNAAVDGAGTGGTATNGAAPAAAAASAPAGGAR